jgi:hypothetical protein
MKEKLKPCPFCGGQIRIQLTDEEGNFRSESYLDNPYSGISYCLLHEEKDVPKGIHCPIATFDDDCRFLGIYLFDTFEEAIAACNERV